MNIDQLQAIKDQASLLHSADAIATALNKIAVQLTEDYAKLNPIFMVVMNGGLIVAGQLLPRLNFPLQVDFCHATRYRGATSGGEIEWKVLPHLALENRHVVLIDDILDEGYTLQAIIKDCLQRNVASVKTLVLVEKLHSRKAIENMRPDYCELQTPDEYVFGYGMDVNHYWRNADGIYFFKQP